MYTIKEVAEMFKCNPETIKRQIYKGKIKAIKIGKVWRITQEEIDRIKRGE